MMDIIWSAVAAALFLLFTSVAEPAGYPGSLEPLNADSNRKWWETAVIYQIYPRSFKDSDGDGIGDLKGITDKLEYLKELGVGAVWLSPIYPSPQADFGYDISDFLGIDPQYGTMDDFDTLLDTAHNLGLKVVLDFVPNHSSDEHVWFQKSVRKMDKYSDYYVWVDGKNLPNGTRVPPNNWLSNFRGSAWEWNDQRQQYYLHQYAVKQPDLNYRNPQVVLEMKDAIRFWLQKGVDGLRVDSIITLFEDADLKDEPRDTSSGQTDPEEHDFLSHVYTENQPETYNMVKQWRMVMDEFDDQRIMMTEAYATLSQTIDYYGTPEEPGASFSFNFYLISALDASSKAADFKKVIDDWMSKMDDFRKPNWVIGNHDRFRVGSFFRYGQELADGINMISLMLPGTAMTYNGEEIGMDNTYITWEQTKDTAALSEGPRNYLMHSRDLERTPFQWDDSISAGFSSNKKTWLPVNPNFWHINVQHEQQEEHSHLKMYKALLQARKKPAVQSSNYFAQAVGNVLVITRDLIGEESFIVVVNLDSEESSIKKTDIGSYSSLSVWTSSVNSNRRPGDIVSTTISLRPKESLVLTTEQSSRKWWETAVVYQIYPRSFKDSDGNGIGDLNGITSKLNYLKDLGVRAIWLSPIYPSPQADFGYDISNFIDIDPMYGTMKDFDNLLGEAHKLGLKVLLDFVPNHSSDEHEWFQKSIQRIEPYTDFYVWHDGKEVNGSRVPPNNWVQAFVGSAWEWNSVRKQYYLHQYAVKQPDLNYRNPSVVNEMKDAIRFWLRRGVDGLRVDSVHTLFEDEQLRDAPINDDGSLDNMYTTNLPETYDMVHQWRVVMDEFEGQRIMMTETYGSMDQVIAYYGTPEKPGASFTFNFNMIWLSASSKAKDFKDTIDSWMSKMDDFRKPNWVIGNHDQFRVGSFFRYGQELADGINMISLMLPGTAMTYNGEEIGMDNTYITWEQSKDPQAVNQGQANYLMHSRDLERTPFQWDRTTSAGFSTNANTWMPVNPNYWRLNVQAQLQEEHSHLKMYKALLQAREMPAVQGSHYVSKTLGNVLVITRDLYGHDSFIVLVNFDSAEAVLNIGDIGSYNKLMVWTSSVNSELRPGDPLLTNFIMRPKEGLVLTTGLVDHVTTQRPASSTEKLSTTQDLSSSTQKSTTSTSPITTTQKNGGYATRAVITSVLLPFACLWS